MFLMVFAIKYKFDLNIQHNIYLAPSIKVSFLILLYVAFSFVLLIFACTAILCNMHLNCLHDVYGSLGFFYGGQERNKKTIHAFD